MRNIFTRGGMASCLAALALYGCSLGTSETTPARTYFLNPAVSVKKFSANPARSDPATLLISAPKAQAGFDTARMAYLPRQHELSYYAFSQWADPPGRMLHRILTEAMEATGLWRAVMQAPSAVRPDYRLDCDNLALEQQFTSTPSRVRLALRAQLINAKRQAVVGVRDFEIFEASRSEDAYGGVVAANQASAKLLEQLTQWAKTALDDEMAGGR